MNYLNEIVKIINDTDLTPEIKRYRIGEVVDDAYHDGIADGISRVGTAVNEVISRQIVQFCSKDGDL